MLNSYADVLTFKSAEYADISTNTAQVAFRQLLEQASRHMDKQTHRYFYCWEGIKYYNGKYGNLLIEDLLGVPTIKLDEDGDGVYEATMAATDYILYPLNEFPKTYIKISPNSNFGSFAGSILEGVEIAETGPTPGSGDAQCGVAQCGGAECWDIPDYITDPENWLFYYLVQGDVPTGSELLRLKALLQRIAPGHCIPIFSVIVSNNVCGIAECGEAVCDG